MNTVPSDAPTSEASGAPTGEPAGEPGSDADSGPRVTSEQLRDVTRLRRTVLGERRVAGVAGGLARHLDIDPLLVRVAFVVLALFGGSGVLLYGALWLLLPEDGAASATIRLDERSLTVALIGVGAIAGLALLGSWSDARWVSWPLAVVALVVLLFASARDRRPAPPARGSYPPAGYPPVSYPPVSHPAPTTASAPTEDSGDPTMSQDTLTPDGATPAPSPGPATQTAQLPPPPAPPAGPGWSTLPPPPPPLRDPRRRGPLLFWFTLALITLGIGVLGMVDVAGTDVSASAYPALATGVAGVMLLVGAFYGRAGGIIFLGLIAATVLAGTAVGERIETDQNLVRPATPAEVVDTYSQGAGELVYDLTAIENVAALDGRRIVLEQGAGRIEVIVPSNVDVVTTTSVGAGNVKLFDTTRDGLGIDFTQRHDVANEAATIYLTVQLGLGEIAVHGPTAGITTTP